MSTVESTNISLLKHSNEAFFSVIVFAEPLH